MANSSWQTSSSLERSVVHLTEVIEREVSLRIAGYSLTKQLGSGKYINSGIQTIGGYDWVLRYRYHPGVYDTYGSLTKYPQISAYLSVVSKVEEAIVAEFGVRVANPAGSKSSPEVKSVGTVNSKEDSFRVDIIKGHELEHSSYLKDDCFLLQCTVRILKEASKKLPKVGRVVIPPPLLHHDLGELLKSAKGSDISFNVGGKIFKAHRCVLAARGSEYFDAMLSWPEKDDGNSSGREKECGDPFMVIEDMNPEVFNAMLHFMYTDFLPEMRERELTSADTEEGNTIFLQHLLEAADRYNLERLKLICEDKLCDRIDVETVGTTLTLAHQHNCNELKAVCMNFIARPEVLKLVMKTEGFKHLKESSSEIMEELLMIVTNV